MLDSKIIKDWQNGILTDYGVYEKSETDAEFYNFLGSQGYDEEQIKEKMMEVSGADDAYYNALNQIEWEEDE